MSLEDPFFVVRDEVKQSIANAQNLYSQWSTLIEGEDLTKLQSVATDLRNCFKSIEWDLEDLQQTINIAESNPRKFRLDPSELETRKQFIRDIQATVKRIRDHIDSDSSNRKVEQLKKKALVGSEEKKPRGKYAKLEEELVRSNQDFIDQQRRQQQAMLTQQDQSIDEVGSHVQTLKQIGEAIGDELDEQAVVLEEFDREMEQTESRIQALTKRVNKAIAKSSDKCQIICIICLVLSLVLIIPLFFIPT
ncbi:hypothetical protein EMCRGX_G021218 [Ephydatia muelleri]|eukprot:Em0016g1099a